MQHYEEKKLGLARCWQCVLTTVVVAVLCLSATAYALRGQANREGIARNDVKPDVVRISRTLQEISSHPCEGTTGRAEMGTHLILEGQDGRELNIHVGPTPAVAETVERLSVGKRLDVLAFRTPQMPADEYVAKTLVLANRFIRLRDAQLRPSWAGSPDPPRGMPMYPDAYRETAAAPSKFTRGPGGRIGWGPDAAWPDTATPVGVPLSDVPWGAVDLAGATLHAGRAWASVSMEEPGAAHNGSTGVSTLVRHSMECPVGATLPYGQW